MSIDRLVTDTHPLLHYLCGNQKKLSKRVKLAFDNAFATNGTIIHVPSIVLAEISPLIQKQIIKLTMPFEIWIDELFMNPSILPLKFDHEAAKKVHSLLQIRDPFDRAIVASALRLELPLITNDGLLHELEPCELYW